METKFCPFCGQAKFCRSTCALWNGKQKSCVFVTLVNTAADKNNESEGAITYREYLNSCDNLDFAVTVLRKAAELEGKYCNSDLDDNELREAIENDFIVWLSEEVT